MIVTKDFRSIKQIQFDTMVIDTEQRSISITFDEDNDGVLSLLEIYSAVKELWVRHADSLMMHPFPVEHLTPTSIRLNRPWKLLIQ